MDFDACKEIWRFFSQFESTASVSEEEPLEVHIFPNPAEEDIVIDVTPGYTITEVTVRDTKGRLVERKKGKDIDSMDIYHLKAGSYILEISGKGFTVSKKLLIASPATN